MSYAIKDSASPLFFLFFSPFAMHTVFVPGTRCALHRTPGTARPQLLRSDVVSNCSPGCPPVLEDGSAHMMYAGVVVILLKMVNDIKILQAFQCNCAMTARHDG